MFLQKERWESCVRFVITPQKKERKQKANMHRSVQKRVRVHKEEELVRKEKNVTKTKRKEEQDMNYRCRSYACMTSLGRPPALGNW